jgi:hypothetical protein
VIVVWEEELTADRAAKVQRLRAEARYLEAAARLAGLEATKVANEIARQPLEARKLEAETRRDEVDADAAASACFRAEVMLVVFLLITVLTLALALVSPGYLQAVGGGGALGVLVLAAGRHARFGGSGKR